MYLAIHYGSLNKHSKTALKKTFNYVANVRFAFLTFVGDNTFLIRKCEIRMILLPWILHFPIFVGKTNQNKIGILTVQELVLSSTVDFHEILIVSQTCSSKYPATN